MPDGRYLAGITGRLVELFTDGVPTVCLSLYLSPHTVAVTDAVRAAWSTGLPVNVTTIAEAVGSDVTNVVRSCVEQGRFGAAAHVLSSYLAQDHCVAVSEYTARAHRRRGRRDRRASTARAFAEQCRERIRISYPAIDTSQYLDLDPALVDGVLAARGPRARRLRAVPLAPHAGEGRRRPHRRIRAHARRTSDSGSSSPARGPDAEALRELAAASPLADRIVFLDDVDDAEKPYLMAGCAAYVLPSKPRPEFVETFGIALAEKMLAGGGAVITTDTGGIGEAVGDHAHHRARRRPRRHRRRHRHARSRCRPRSARHGRSGRAPHALQFDRGVVFDRLFDGAGVLPARIPA